MNEFKTEDIQGISILISKDSHGNLDIELDSDTAYDNWLVYASLDVAKARELRDFLNQNYPEEG